MTGRVRLVVFDLDGTLVDSSGDLATGINRMTARVAPGTPALPVELVRTFIGEGARVLVARSVAHLRLDARPEDVLPVFLDEYRKVLLDTTRLYPGVADALDALDGRTLAVLTNKPGDMSRRILEGLGVAGRFLRIVGGGDVPTKKPDPEGLRLVMAEAGAGPADTLMVGDSAVDVRTGRAAGALTAGVTYGFDVEGMTREGPDLVVDRLDDLPARL